MKKLFWLLPFMSLSLASNAQTDSDLIVKVLNQQQADWNKGDINGYMQGYWKSDSLVFVGKNGVRRGWNETLSNYQKSYPDRATMGKLEFTVLEFDFPCEDTATMVGKWFLRREIGDVGGHFSLVWKRINGQWVIVNDHSS